MSERVIAITGASAGIGRATALRMARDGASVAICARRQERLEAAAAEIEGAGGKALPIVADAIARAIERPVAEVFPHFKSRALVWANAFAPAFCDRVCRSSAGNRFADG